MTNQYKPDSVSPISETIQELMEHIGIDVFHLSILSGVNLSIIINMDEDGLNKKDCIRISTILNLPSSFLLNRQKHINEFRDSN